MLKAFSRRADHSLKSSTRWSEMLKSSYKILQSSRSLREAGYLHLFVKDNLPHIMTTRPQTFFKRYAVNYLPEPILPFAG